MESAKEKDGVMPVVDKAGIDDFLLYIVKGKGEKQL